MNVKINRRRFLLSLFTAVAGSGLALSGCTPQPEPVKPAEPLSQPTLPDEPPAPTTTVPAAEASPSASGQVVPSATTETAATKVVPAPVAGDAQLSVVHGADVESITRAAVLAVGGMERYVKAGQNVVVKPNICVDYHSYEHAVTTNPIVVATLVKLALEAGAKRVRVMDMPFGGTPESAYRNSGIADAVADAGGEMEVMSPIKFKETDIPEGKDIRNWVVYKGALDADVIINVPIAKNHRISRLTLSTKNLFGLVRDPGGLHRNLGQRAADLLSLVRPTLTVIDAVRILMNNGPTGGDLNDVKKMDTIIASPDGVAADSYATTLFGLKGEDIEYITAADAMGLGTMDYAALKVEEINV